jgi:hypothetical protein
MARDSYHSDSSGAPEKTLSRDKAEAMIKDGAIRRCRNLKCFRALGVMENDRNLIAGEIVLVNRTPVYCRMCRTRNVFTPE